MPQGTYVTFCCSDDSGRNGEEDGGFNCDAERQILYSRKFLYHTSFNACDSRGAILVLMLVVAHPR